MAFMPIDNSNFALARILKGVQSGGPAGPRSTMGIGPAWAPGGGGAGMDSANNAYMDAARSAGSTTNQALAAYGQQLPTNPNPYLMFSNAPGSFGANHPGFAGAIDNAMGALANMGPTSMSAGDNISNVARGVLGNRSMHQQYLMQQYQAPFQLANQTAQLQNENTVNQMNQLKLGAMPQEISDAHNMAQAHASYFTDVGGARQQAADAAEYKADPAGFMVKKENERRVALGGDPMDADGEAGYRKLINSQIADTAKAQAAGKVDVKKTVPGKAPGSGTKKIDPVLKMQHDDAAKKVTQIQSELDKHMKSKTGEYFRNGGDTKKAELQKSLLAAQQEFATTQSNISDAQSAAHRANVMGGTNQPSQYSAGNPFAH